MSWHCRAVDDSTLEEGQGRARRGRAGRHVSCLGSKTAAHLRIIESFVSEGTPRGHLVGHLLKVTPKILN